MTRKWKALQRESTHQLGGNNQTGRHAAKAQDLNPFDMKNEVVAIIVEGILYIAERLIRIFRGSKGEDKCPWKQNGFTNLLKS